MLKLKHHFQAVHLATQSSSEKGEMNISNIQEEERIIIAIKKENKINTMLMKIKSILDQPHNF